MSVSIYYTIIAIIYLNKSVETQSSINSTVTGNLMKNWNFNFTLLTKEFNGGILYCIDNERNQIGISVVRGVKKDKQIRIDFNDRNKMFSLSKLCGCASCDETTITFVIYLENDIFNLACNNGAFESLSVYGSKKIDKKLMGPMRLENETDTMYIIIGSIEPFVTNNDNSSFASKEPLKGCLKAFYHNNKRVIFTSNKSDLRPSCNQDCSKNICKNGLCKERYDGMICNCTSTALNGLYCNNSMTVYSRGNNTFTKINKAPYVLMKMTWKQMLFKKYCLMEIINGEDHSTMTIDNNELLLDNEHISDISVDGVNYVSVNVTNINIIIKTANHSRQIDSTMLNNVRMNIGYSDRNKVCQVFEGAYNIYFENMQIYFLRQTTSFIQQHSTESLLNLKSSEIIATKASDSKILKKWSLMIIPLLGIIFIIGIIVIYLINKQQMEILKKNVSVALTNAYTTIAIPDSAVYSQVQDNYDYDLIEEYNENNHPV